MKQFWVLGSLVFFLVFLQLGLAKTGPELYENPIEHSSDTIPLKDRKGDFITDKGNNPFDLDDPKAVKKEVSYDPATGRYIITEKIGEDYFRAPTSMTFKEYLEWRSKEQNRKYFQSLAGIETEDGTSAAKVDPVSRVDIKRNLIDRLFGGSEVSIKPQGSIDLTFGLNHQNVENPILTRDLQRYTNFDFRYGYSDECRRKNW